MTFHAITLVGHDRPGIIADTTRRLADLGQTLEESSVRMVRGHFAMTLVTAGPAAVGDIEAALSGLTSDGSLELTVHPLPDNPPPALGQEWALTVHGARDSGNVAALLDVLVNVGGNVTDLRTTVSGELSVLTARVLLPRDTALDPLRNRIQSTAAELGVSAAFGRPESAN